jgi:hypothetical protein
MEWWGAAGRLGLGQSGSGRWTVPWSGGRRRRGPRWGLEAAGRGAGAWGWAAGGDGWGWAAAGGWG